MKNLKKEVMDILNIVNSRFKELDGEECAEYANKLAVLLSSILDKEADAEGESNLYQLQFLERGESVAAAEVRMKASPQYINYRKIRALRIGLEETIRTLKQRVKVKTSEYNEFSKY